MARTFSLGLIVAVLLVFAITDASRGQTHQVDGQKIQNRGTTRYHSKPTTESSSFPVSTTKSSRDRTVSRTETVSDLTKHETYLATESSIKTRLKPSNAAAASSRTSVNRLASPNIDNVQHRNRSKSHTQAPKKEIITNRRDDNKENVLESQAPKRQTASRRASSETSAIWVDDAKLDLEVFTKSPGHLRSRTGRKIYANLNGKESKDQTVTPRKVLSDTAEKIESPKNRSEKEKARMEHSTENVLKANVSSVTKGMNGSGNHKYEVKERDIVLSGSESVRVDIPLTVANDEDANSNFLASGTIVSSSVPSRQTSRPIKEKTESNDIARSNTKKSRHSDRSKSRARSNANDPTFDVNFGLNVGSASSRRGSSKFDGTATAETTGRSANSRHRSGGKGTRTKSRSRSSHKSKDSAKSSGRSRVTDSEFEKNGRTEKRRSSSSDRRTSEGKRRSSDSRSKVTETRTNEQDRAQIRGRSRSANSFEITTAYIPKATVAEATTVSSVGTEITTSSPALVTTARTSTATRTSSSTERTSRNKGRDRGENARSKKPPKEDFFNHGLGFRGRKSSTEAPSSNVADLRTTTAKSETQLRGNPGWTLRRRPSHVNQDIPSTTAAPINRDQANEIILPTDSSTSTETPLNNANAGRRGTKRPKAKDESNTVSGIAKSVTRGNKTFNKSESVGLPKRVEFEESDNYPPAFRARLSQLKTNVKPTGAKSITRTHLQATKSSAATLFSERSKMKLDLARRLIKPELNVDENEFDVTTKPYSGKSKAKEVTAVSESRNVEKTTKATKANGIRIGSRIIDNEEKEKSRARARWKFLENRKSLKDRNLEASRPSTITTRKSRLTTDKTTTPLSAKGSSTRKIIEYNVIPRGKVSHRGSISTEETPTTTPDTANLRSSLSQSTVASKEATSTLVNTVKPLDNSVVTTIEPMKLGKMSTESGLDKQELNDIYDTQKRPTTVTITDASESMKTYTTEFPQEVTLSPTVTTYRSTNTFMTVTPEKVYPVYVPDDPKKTRDSLENKGKTNLLDDATKPAFRPRYTQQEEADKVAVSMVVSRTVGPTSRYIRKKSGVFTPFDAVPKPSSTEPTTQTKRREFRPRTATYRRHSEMPTSQLIQQTTAAKENTIDVSITPKPTNYYPQIVTPNTRFSPFEPFVSVTIDNSNNVSFVPGITDSNNNSNGSNFISPTSNMTLGGNTTALLDQLRSTVAPLLNSLGEKTPVFSGAYSNVDTGNSAPRITPNGSPPRFSARYKGAELLVRKPSIGQGVVPSITTSSTTASTPLENSIGLAPSVDINSPGEPRFVTFYRALESASIRNENLGTDQVSQQRQTLTGGVTKVDSNATVPNGASNDTANNNDTATSPNATITTTTSSPDTTTVDTTTITTTIQPANVSFSSRLGTENTPNDTTSMTVETPTNPTPSGDTTPSSVTDITSAPTSESPNNSIMSTSEPNTTEGVTTLTSTSVDEVMPTSTESISDARSTEQPTDPSTVTTEMASNIESTSLNVPMPTSQNLSDMAVSSPSPENVTMTPEISPEMTTMPAMNTVEQFNETTTSRTTDASNGMSENIMANTDPTMFQTTESSTEINNIIESIEQLDTTIPSEVTETTSTTEPTTTEEISNNIIPTKTPQAPIATSTLRTRLIDFAQDILSRLQSSLKESKTPNRKPISTTTSSVLSNAIPDSSSTNRGSPAQIQETTTMQEVGSGNDIETISQMSVEATTGQSADVESVVTTTTDGSTQEMTIQNTVGLDTPNPNVERRLSSNVNVERNATLNSTMTTIQDSLGDSPIDAATTTSMPRFVDFVTENYPSSSSNDTLLTELMTIAKTLFSEAMNDTRQSSLVPSQISDFEATTVPDVSNLSRANGTMGNDDKDQARFSGDMSEKTTLPLLPTSLETTTERINVVSVGLPGNETENNSTRASMIGSEISLLDFNARPTNVESPIDIGDVTATPEMSLSQIKIETTNTITPTSMSFELITNTSDSQAFNPTQLIDNNIEQQSTVTIDFAQSQFTTLSNNNIEFATDLTTNNPSVMNSVNAAGMLDLNESTTMNVETGLITSVAIPEVNVQTNDTNQATGSIINPASDPTNDRFLVTNANTTTVLPMIFDDNANNTFDTSDTQPFTTEPPLTESVRNLVNIIETTTNQFNDITTIINASQMTTNLINETSTLIARFQDTTTATTTAQGTAGSTITQPAQTTTVPTITTPTTTSPTSPDSSIIDMTTTPSLPVETTAATTTTTTQATTTMTMTTTTTTTPGTTSTIDINENLISTETSTDASTTTTQGTTPSEVDDLNMISGMDNEMTTTTMSTTAATTTTAAPMNMSTTPMTTPPTTSTTQATMSNATTSPTFAPVNPFNAYFGRFGGNQITPTSRPSSSSSRTPVRDYLIYGIYPNKTIVRKRPEDNLIDPRNVDSPYVIFGIYPDGRLVRKFPNGTIIPDSPRNPVEVVFTLRTTTTTNRPAPRPFYNQANQAGTYNQYQAPIYNNRRPVDELTGGSQSPSPIDFGLNGNAIGVPPGVGSVFAGPFGPPASVPSTNKMSDILLNTQMGTLPNVASTIGNMQTPNTNNVQLQGPAGRIISDSDFSEASRTRVTSDQRSSVYIGQDKYINYQINGAPNVNPNVVDVRINSVATSVNEGTASSTASLPSFENLLNQSDSNGVITAPPGFPWRDPLDQIFGITTSSPIQTASVASNQLDEPDSNMSIMSRPVNPQVEIFTPIMGNAAPSAGSTTTSTTSSPSSTSSTTPATTTTPSTTTAATTTSTTAPSTTTAATTTSTTAPSTTTAATTASTTAPSTTTAATTTTTTMTTTTTTTTTTSTTTPATTTIATSQPTTVPSTTLGTVPSTTVRLGTTASSIITNDIPRITSLPTLSANELLNGLQANTKENAFGTTFDDLAFLNSLLQNNNVKVTTPKTLSDVEQMLANRILALALAKPGPTRSPKAIPNASSKANFNSIKNPSSGSPSEPIIIDLLPYSSSSKLGLSTSAAKRQLETSSPMSAQPSSTSFTTKAPVVITAKTKTAKPKTTTQAPIGFGMSLWRALFGGNFFDATTSASTGQKSAVRKASPKPVQITQKPVEITQKPIQSVKSTPYTSHIMSAIPTIKSLHSTRNVDISDIRVASTASFVDNIASASGTTPSSISSTTFLNNPNPRLNNIPTSTYSPEDDAKFLAALLRALQTESQTSSTSTTTQSTSTTTQRAITEDDEAFLRALLGQQPSFFSTTAASLPTEVNSAALLALLLKQQGIEPPTPATNLREQLQLASLNLPTQIQSNPPLSTRATPTTTRTTTTSRPNFSPTPPSTVGTTRRVTSTPRLQTTTDWFPISSTYPPPFFGSNTGSNLATATRVFGRFLGAAISGAAQQFQSLLGNGTRNVIG